jgi:hypothetical protein
MRVYASCLDWALAKKLLIELNVSGNLPWHIRTLSRELQEQKTMLRVLDNKVALHLERLGLLILVGR